MSITIEQDLKEILTKIDQRLENIQSDITDIKIGQARLEGEIKRVEGELKGDIKRVEGELKGEIKRVEDKVEGIVKELSFRSLLIVVF